MNKIYAISAKVNLSSPIMDRGKNNKKIVKKGKAPLRQVEISSNKSLYALAELIVRSFGFYFDHCFGFFGNLEKKYNSEEAYELFNDLPSVEPTEAGSIKESKIKQVYNKIGKKMLFYFDYGDGWSFITELKEIKEVDKNKNYPLVSKKLGPNPEQYPRIEEDY